MLPPPSSSHQNPSHALRSNSNASPLCLSWVLSGNDLSLSSAHTALLSTSLCLSFISHKMRIKIVSLLHDPSFTLQSLMPGLYFPVPQDTEQCQEYGRNLINDLIEHTRALEVAGTDAQLEAARSAPHPHLGSRQYGDQQNTRLEISKVWAEPCLSLQLAA